MTTTEILQKAREKIESPKDWCRREFARDRSGKRCDPTGSEAKAWCAKGAILHVTGWSSVSGDNAACLLMNVSRELFKSRPAVVNDSGTHKDVMRMYDAAIQRAQARKVMA